MKWSASGSPSLARATARATSSSSTVAAEGIEAVANKAYWASKTRDSVLELTAQGGTRGWACTGARLEKTSKTAREQTSGPASSHGGAWGQAAQGQAHAAARAVRLQG